MSCLESLCHSFTAVKFMTRVGFLLQLLDFRFDLRGSNATKRVEGSTLVGLRHPVIDLQEAFKAGSIFFRCDDLLHTSETYSSAV